MDDSGVGWGQIDMCEEFENPDVQIALRERCIEELGLGMMLLLCVPFVVILLDAYDDRVRIM